ncbi:LOW QUALITY PROTEIN: hypothetical protein T265_13105 [Opisthorchis viverrini]|uniref:Endonuclease/exonuclease/phosphatase domain-containing protein n=1 Tax=Opisthorchis viverrini TaxID=6198 RepID=A0A074ZTK9_OPIVI|nr:LOW QUALITY PROTEIN: hypothetical protein T265_13105 [Opisthorchis viverrini]KER30793.1 LOW QUALITY PROTEIN: hypothetical protein T265_13105 [Opisthorchis viverrini]
MCSVSGTRFQDATAPSPSTHFRLRTSGDSDAVAAKCTGFVTVLSHRVKESLLDRILVGSSLCTFCLLRSVKETHKRMGCSLSMMSAHAPNDGSSDTIKGRFHDNLNALLRCAYRPSIVEVAGDLNIQMERLSMSETGLGGRHRLESLCVDHRLFLCRSTNFRSNQSSLAICCPPKGYRLRAQLVHVAISNRWCSLITKCRIYSDHELIRSRFSLRIPGARKQDVRRVHCSPPLESLPTAPLSDVNSCWNEINSSLHSAESCACGTALPGPFKHLTSKRKVAMLEFHPVPYATGPDDYCHLHVVVGLECCNDPAGYTGWNFVPQGATMPGRPKGSSETPQYEQSWYGAVWGDPLSDTGECLARPPIIGERNCGSYNQCMTSTRFLQLTMMMMMTYHRAQL